LCEVSPEDGFRLVFQMARFGLYFPPFKSGNFSEHKNQNRDGVNKSANHSDELEDSSGVNEYLSLRQRRLKPAIPDSEGGGPAAAVLNHRFSQQKYATKDQDACEIFQNEHGNLLRIALRREQDCNWLAIVRPPSIPRLKRDGELAANILKRFLTNHNHMVMVLK